MTAAPDDTLATVLARMRLYDISQLPVLDNDKVVGIIDEWDLLRHIGRDADRFSLPDGGHDGLGRISDKQAPESALYAIFDRGLVAIIYDETAFWV